MTDVNRKKERARQYYLAHADMLRKRYRNAARKMARENPQAYYGALAKRVGMWRIRNPEKTIAHRQVFVAVRAGRLKRKKCVCGKRGEAHHDDYSKPLDVLWMCKLHHRAYHRGDFTLKP